MTAVLPARPSAAERRAAPSLAAAVRDLDSRRARSRQRMIGASELGECRRRAAYRIARSRPTNTRTGLQAFMGTELHRGVLRALRRQYGGLTEVGLKGEQVRGRCDWWHAPVVEDLKTTSRFGFERVLTRGVPVRHWFQVAVYAWLLRTGQTADRRLPAAAGQDVDGLRIRYLSRDSGEDVVFEADHDPALTAEAIMWLTDVYATVEDEGVDAVPAMDSVPAWTPCATGARSSTCAGVRRWTRRPRARSPASPASRSPTRTTSAPSTTTTPGGRPRTRPGATRSTRGSGCGAGPGRRTTCTASGPVAACARRSTRTPRSSGWSSSARSCPPGAPAARRRSASRGTAPGATEHPAVSGPGARPDAPDVGRGTLPHHRTR